MSTVAQNTPELHVASCSIPPPVLSTTQLAKEPNPPTHTHTHTHPFHTKGPIGTATSEDS